MAGRWCSATRVGRRRLGGTSFQLGVLAPGRLGGSSLRLGVAPSGVARGLVTATRPKAISRFYQKTSVGEHGGVWRVFLDGKPVKTPRGTFLELPSEPLAQAVALEWGAQGEKLRPQEMPLTTVGCTAVDLIRPSMGDCVGRIMPYLAMDTLCFDDDKPDLAKLQGQEWAPLRQWFEAHFGVELSVGRGLRGPGHPEATLAAVEAALLGRDEWELGALEIATSTSKSLVVAAALLERPGALPKEAMRLALLEEFFQIEKWGLVEGEHDLAHSECLMWLETCQRFGRLGRTLAPGGAEELPGSRHAGVVQEDAAAAAAARAAGEEKSGGQFAGAE